MEYALLNYYGEIGACRAGLLVEGKIVLDMEAALKSQKTDIEGPRPITILRALENWDMVLPRLRDVASGNREPGDAVIGPLSEVKLAAPLLYPSNIYCAAANYVSHGKEMGDRKLPDKNQSRPYFFTKLPRQTVIGPDESIRIPYLDAKVDWEAEIGVVIGRHTRNVPASEAMEYVAGFVILNDLSDRARNFRKDWDFKFDWLGGKSFDTSAPMGPWITPVEFVPDPHNLTIQLWVNDELMQNASSADMYFSIPEQIEYLSELVTLLPGDVISTGTPDGVGHPQGLYLKPGDKVTISIERLGSISNPVIAGY